MEDLREQIGKIIQSAGKVKEKLYSCDNCGKLRTKDEGGTVFTVCSECWDKHLKNERLTRGRVMQAKQKILGRLVD